MTQITSDGARTTGATEIGSQPIALAAGAFLAIVFGVVLVGGWRAYSGSSPEQERLTTVRHAQLRASQVFEPSVDSSARALQLTQQDTVDELQVVQDQLQMVRRLLAAQQAETKRLAEQVSSLREAIDGLRQSFTNAQASDLTTVAPPTRSIQTRFQSK